MDEKPNDDPREALADLLADERDKYPRSPLDMDSDELADAILASDWLAEHDRMVAANAWDEGADRMYEFCQDEQRAKGPDFLPTQPVNPYRITEENN